MDPITIVFKIKTYTNSRDDNEVAEYINKRLEVDKELDTLLKNKTEVAEVEKRIVRIKHPLLIFDRVISHNIINPSNNNWHLGFEVFSKDYRCVEILPDRTFVCYETSTKKLIFVQLTETYKETLEVYTAG